MPALQNMSSEMCHLGESDAVTMHTWAGMNIVQEPDVLRQSEAT